MNFANTIAIIIAGPFFFGVTDGGALVQLNGMIFS
jgi:hypothetical protein